jgi:hypothetical protein
MTTSSRKLTLDDIADMRAYERERAEFRQRVIELKKRRRVGIGPFITVLFENRETIRFQIQEMARVERLYSDEAIEGELRAYNPLIPEPGHLAATMFLELTSEEQLREWLPKLTGVERSVQLRIGDGDAAAVVPLVLDADHAEQLTREETTSAVHYLHASLEPEQIEAFVAGRVALVVTHPDYPHSTTLSDETVTELLADLRP